MVITIFTPAYNRSAYLYGIYLSLKKQTFLDFEWIIVDDGSTDNTKESVEKILNSNPPFPVRYFFKENGGKHTAINRGVKEAQGELFLILDSDDTLPSNSLQEIISQYKDVADNETICGVSGLMAHHDGTLIGSGYPKECNIASSIEQRYKYDVTGDLIEVFKTSSLREFPFPEIEGERFCSEQVVWFRIAQKYKLKCFNKVVYFRDYLDGGLTDNITKIRMKSPIASMMCYAELNNYDVPFIQKLKAAINYWRFRFCSKTTQNIPSIGAKWFGVIPIAYIMHIGDVIRTKEAK